MGIRDMFGRKEEFPEEMEETYMEVNVMESDDAKMKGKIGIRIEKLSEFADIQIFLKLG